MSNPYGLFEVYSSPSPVADIVFVHGLNGNPYRTWTASNGCFWPAELLPQYLKTAPCRILTYGYNSNVSAFTDGASKDNILNHAENLAAYLVADRSECLERPLIFVCHSLGGLVVKRCLIMCKGLSPVKGERRRSVFVSTYGIVFLGTPHTGSDIAKWGSMLQSIASAALPRKLFDSQPQLIEALKTNNEILQNINAEFVSVASRLHIYFFHESKPTDLKGTRQFVVDERSAAPVLEGAERAGIEQDHSTMCKFEDVNAPGFKLVAEAVSRYARESPDPIMIQWEAERHIREFELQQSAILGRLGRDVLIIPGSRGSSPDSRLMRQSMSDSFPQLQIESASQNHSPTSPTTSTLDVGTMTSTRDLLVAPLGFRPNSIFEGFAIELARLEDKLQNKRRSEIGTCATLLWGPPGCGKSHLARQYVWLHRKQYPQGVFWIDCKTEESVKKGFWDVAQALRCLNGQITYSQDDVVVDAVRHCLESKQDWLMVFDGISFKNDAGLSKFRRLLPDTQGGYIIYTSVDSTLAHRQRLLDPSSIKVYPLSEKDACVVLFRSLRLSKQPNSSELEKARQLVHHYECLPLGIHAAAHMLLARGRPLVKYTPGPSDERLSAPFLDIVAALRENGCVEAVNLLFIMSFINHEVPVRLFHLGRRFLLDKFDVDIRSVYGANTSQKELDNTIGLLIRTGLLERTLQTGSSPSEGGTSSPEGFRDQSKGPQKLKTEGSTGLDYRALEHDSAASNSTMVGIDVVRLHTVVQNVIVEDLTKLPDQYQKWLSITTLFLCNSYRRACTQMRGRGLVQDHREYETHAAKLWSHYPKTSKNATPLLRSARKELQEIRSMIRQEIESQSPSQSSDSSGRRHFISIFERSGSSSDEGPPTPNSNLTRASTWTVDPHTAPSESPIQEQSRTPLDASWHEDFGYVSDFEKTPPRTTKPSSTPTQEVNTRRQATLQAIFEGSHSQSTRRKDLGEWKPVPALASVSSGDVEPVRSRTSSSGHSRQRSSSTNSQAEAALSAVHRMSPPSSRNTSRQPLNELSANTPLEQDPKDKRKNPTSSPRLVQAVLSSNAMRNQLPYDENINITRPLNRSSLPVQVPTTSEYPPLPTGYTSQPMSRNTSRESNMDFPSEQVEMAFSLSDPRSMMINYSTTQLGQVLDSTQFSSTEPSRPAPESVVMSTPPYPMVSSPDTEPMPVVHPPINEVSGLGIAIDDQNET